MRRFVTPIALAAALVATVVLVGAPVGAAGAFRPYFPPPFAAGCTVHHFGEGEPPPLKGIPDDPLCVEYAKRDITISNGGALRFLLAEPARFLVAVPKCRYWQQDHWSVQLAPHQLAVVRWDGSYWFDQGAGQAGARLHNLRVAGIPMGAAEAARVIAPISPELAAYFREFSRGGTGAGWAGTIPFNPNCP